MKHTLTLLPILFLTACAGKPSAPTTQGFLSAMTPLCDQTYTGEVVSDDPQDEDWRKEILTLGPIGCSDDGVISIPLAVGEDTSRTWFLYPQDDRIEFRHQHLLKNGEVDPVSDYGGYSENLTLDGGVWRVDFPADEKTVKIFKNTGLDVSITNVWTFEYRAGIFLNYELNRENRNFRAEFELVP